MSEFGSGGRGGGKKGRGKGIDPNASTWENWQAQGLPVGGIFRKANSRIQDAGWVVPRIQRHLALHPEPSQDGGHGDKSDQVVHRSLNPGADASQGKVFRSANGTMTPEEQRVSSMLAGVASAPDADPGLANVLAQLGPQINGLVARNPGSTALRQAATQLQGLAARQYQACSSKCAQIRALADAIPVTAPNAQARLDSLLNDPAWAFWSAHALFGLGRGQQHPGIAATQRSLATKRDAIAAAAGGQPAGAGASGMALEPVFMRLTDAVNELTARPMSDPARADLDQRWQQIQQRWQAFQRATIDPAALAQASAQVEEIRMNASGTVRGRAGAGDSDVAGGNFRAADQMTQPPAGGAPGPPLTIEFISQLNRQLGAGLPNNGVASGRPRGPGDQDVSAGGNFMRSYVPSVLVPPALVDFVGWFNGAEASMHPIQLAAQSYQRLVSIHPFADANGRTCRMVMDWILRRHNLPPAALQGGEVNVAVFGMGDAMGSGGANHDADHAVRMVTQGIERTINILSTAVRT